MLNGVFYTLVILDK